jgi:hypothetical protein
MEVRMRVLAWTFVAVLVPFVPFHAQTTKVAIRVVATIAENDSVGRQVVFELKEAIRASQGFELIEGDPFERRKESFQGDSLAYIRVAIVTLINERNVSTVYAYSSSYDSLVMPLLGGHISLQVGRTGSDRTQQAARRVLASLDEDVEFLKKDRPVFYKNLITR